MRKMILTAGVILGALLGTGANAMPVGQPSAPSASHIQNVDYACGRGFHLTPRGFAARTDRATSVAGTGAIAGRVAANGANVRHGANGTSGVTGGSIVTGETVAIITATEQTRPSIRRAFLLFLLCEMAPGFLTGDIRPDNSGKSRQLPASFRVCLNRH